MTTVEPDAESAPLRRDSRQRRRSARAITAALRAVGAFLVIAAGAGVGYGAYVLASSMSYPTPPEGEVWFTVLAEDPETEFSVTGSWNRENDFFVISVIRDAGQRVGASSRFAVVVSESLAKSAIGSYAPIPLTSGDHPSYILTGEAGESSAFFQFQANVNSEFRISNETDFHTAVHMPTFASGDQFFNYLNPSDDEECGCVVPNPGDPTLDEVLGGIASSKSNTFDRIYNLVGYDGVAYRAMRMNNVTSRVTYGQDERTWANETLDVAYPEPSVGINSWTREGEHLYLNVRATYTSLGATDRANQLYVFVGVLASLAVAIVGLGLRVLVPRSWFFPEGSRQVTAPRRGRR